MRKKIKIGIIDYDLGNQDSLYYFLKSLRYKVFISKDPKLLSELDLIILPGVGAFPKAMESLEKSGIDKFIIEWSKSNKPLVGICLGMQLLCSCSTEFVRTKGLNLIPGDIVPIANSKWHIGWNYLSFLNETINGISKTDEFYFNHSYKYIGNDDYVVTKTMFDNSFASIIKKNKTIGIQFHPEKSQFSGKKLIHEIIKTLTDG